MINNAYDSNISFSRCCICVGISRFHISKYMTLNKWPSFRLDTWIQFITTSIVLVSFALLLELSLVAISFYLYGTSILPKWPTPFSPPLTALLPSGWSITYTVTELDSKGLFTFNPVLIITTSNKPQDWWDYSSTYGIYRKHRGPHHVSLRKYFVIQLALISMKKAGSYYWGHYGNARVPYNTRPWLNIF